MKEHGMLWDMGPLCGDTLIITNTGIKKLKDHKDCELVSNPEGLHSTNGLVEKTTEKLIEVETYFGMKLRGTPEHEILTTNGTKTFSELTINDELLIGTPGVFPVKSISKDYAISLGMMVAEGNCNEPQIEFNICGNEDLIEKIRTELKPQGETTRNKNGNITWRAWWSTATVRKTKGNKFPERYTENGHKIVPSIILEADKATQIAFLYGYFRGDGSLRIKESGNISFKLTERDENLVNMVQLMLLNMGIITKKYTYESVNAFNLTAGHDMTNKMISIGLLWGKEIAKQPNFGRYGKGLNSNNGKEYKYKDGMIVSSIVNIKNIDYCGKVYCLSMNNNNHLFFGNGIAVHNTGKTRAAIEIYEIKKAKKEVNHGLVICPLSMVDKWIDEIHKWSDGSAFQLRGSKEQKLETLNEDWEWLVTTYETFERYQDEVLPKINGKWFVALDESTKIKNPTTKRSKACHKLGLQTQHKVILTGTPSTQGAHDVFSQFLFLDGGETFGFKYDAFVAEYFWKEGYKLVEKSGSIKKISDKMFGKSTRFLKKDCIDIPEKMYDQRILELPAYNQEKYNEMVKWAITQVNENPQMCTAPVILTQLLRLSQITSGFIKDVSGNIIKFKENPKLDALRDILEEVNDKVVIWGRFQYDVEQIMELCKEMNLEAVSLYGKDNQQQRTDNIRKFQQGTAKIIVGTTGTGGHGIDLVAGSTVIYFSNSYSLEQRLQSEDRTHRAGQHKQVQYIDLLCKKTVDVSIYKILRAKKNVADMVTKDNLRGLLT
jgi:hypothetical protein